MTVKIYAERDPMALDKAGNHYCRHISAMTAEDLDSKSDIAAELGWRDMQIAELQRQHDDQVIKSATVISELQGKVEALAGENAHLKQSKPSLKTMIQALDAFYADEDTPESAMLIAFNILRGDIKTPSTKAALAEIRAQAVEACAEALLSTDDISCEYEYPMMREFAQQLRKESGQ